MINEDKDKEFEDLIIYASEETDQEKETQEQPPKKEKKKVVPTGKDSVMSD